MGGGMRVKRVKRVKRKDMDDEIDRYIDCNCI